MYYNKVDISGVDTSKLTVLTEAEKMELLKKCKKGDKSARDKLINGNLRLVLSVIQKFIGRGENADDLFQVGCIGSHWQLQHRAGRSVFHIRRPHDMRRGAALYAGQQSHSGKPFAPRPCVQGNAGKGTAYRKKSKGPHHERNCRHDRGKAVRRCSCS